MKPNGLKIGAFLLLAGLWGVPAAQAAEEDKGGYVGAGIGFASASDYCGNDSTIVLASCDDRDTAFKVYGGYKFTPNLGLEVAYVDLGKYKATGTILNLPFDLTTDVRGVTLQAVGIAPIGGGFSVLGRLGGIYWEMKNSANLNGVSGSSKEHDLDIALGLGAQYQFSKAVGMRADFDYYPDLGNDDTGEDNVSAFTIGIVFSF